MRQYRTRTGARRSGDDYQDLVAAEALLRLLRHPSRYHWIKFEAREAGRLDDVLVLRADGTVEASQVRYSTDPLGSDDPWTWQKLLEQSNGRPSLIEAWHESVVKLDELYEITEPRIVSNRRAGDDVLLTSDGYVDCNQTSPSVLEQIHSQLGENSEDFLNRFRFEVDEQDLSDLDQSLWREFQALGVSAQGWLSLKEAIRSWVRGERLPSTGEIRVDDIRYACGWRQLSPLPQNLEIPDDYTLPQPEFHDLFLQRVAQCVGSVIVLTAGPGVGKSTYLSYLVRELRDMGRPVLRHHYSLRASGDPSERLDSQRVAESLMADIKNELGRYLGELDVRSPNPHDLNDWLRQVGGQLITEESHLVVVVDGLDYVWRAQGSQEELRKLFDQLLPLPPGIVLIVGTQRVEDQQLPPSLLALEPRERWIELPRLDREALRQWLSHHRDQMPATPSEDSYVWQLSQMATSLYSRTGGHPLLNRYVIERVTGKGERLAVDSIEAIPATPTASVEDYYRTLWVGLPEGARDIVFLLAVANFPWPDRGLFECLQIAGYDQASSLDGRAAVHHLLARDALGWTPFHGSILHYVRQLPAYTNRAPVLREATIEWLRRQAPGYWRRSFLWLLQRDSGDAIPLLEGSDRRWATEALAAGHPLVDVERVLQAAAWEAIDRGDFPKYVDRGILADSAKWIAAYEDEALRWLFAAQLTLGTDEFLEPRAIAGIAELNDSLVASLALDLQRRGLHDKVNGCFREINLRLDRERANHRGLDDRRQRFEIVSELAGLVGVNPQRFVGFAAKFTTEDMKGSVTESWTAGLRRSCEVRSAIQALGEPSTAQIQRGLSRHVAVVAASEGIHLSQAERKLMTSPYASVYQVFYENQLNPVLPDEPSAPTVTRDSLFGEYARTVGWYVHDLFFFLVIRELQSPGFCNNWAAPTPIKPWLASALRHVAQGARSFAVGWRDTGSVLVDALYDSTVCLQNPSWDDRPVDRESPDGIRNAFRTITEDLLFFRRATGRSAKLQCTEALSIASHRFAGDEEVLRWIADGKTDIERGALEDLCRLLDEDLPTRINPFGERAATFSLLAAACARHGLQARAQQYLRRSSENLLAYGYHKDILLHVALKTVEVGAHHWKARERLWFRLAPAIASVGEFTDGDETSNLPGRLGKLLLRFDPSLAVDYLKWLTEAEQYGVVQEVAAELVQTGDLSNPVVRALVSTFIEPQSIRLLEERATGSDRFAEQILQLPPRFSSGLTDRDSETAASAYPNGSPLGSVDSSDPNRHLKYPPERLSELLETEALASPYARSEELNAWMCYWADTERAAEALHALEPYLLGDARLKVSNPTVDAARKIGGRTRSYSWLIRAQRSNNGWFEYLTEADEVRSRWRSVMSDFPDRWHDFLTESIRPPLGLSPHFGMTIARLVEYLLLFGHSADAHAVAYQFVDTIGDLVSGQELPTPEWTRQTTGGP